MKDILFIICFCLVIFLGYHYITKDDNGITKRNELTLPLSHRGDNYIYGRNWVVKREDTNSFRGLLDLPITSFDFIMTKLSQSEKDQLIIYGLDSIRRHPKKARKYSSRLSKVYVQAHSEDFP